MAEETFQENVRPAKDGIETCEDKCTCGGSLRLHTYTFDRYTSNRKRRYYIDCSNGCGRVGNWAYTLDEAVESFDDFDGVKDGKEA